MARRFYSIANTLNCAIFMDLRSSSALKRNISDLRTKYHDQSNVFTEDLIGVKEPMHLFDKWFREVSVNKDVEVNAMCLSTANQYGIPSARFVLCKEYDEHGFKFFTNFNSRKGKELEENPSAALTFYWEEFHRQVRVEGEVVKLSNDESLAYFHSRPRPSQIGTAISQQSSAITSREYLTNLASEYEELYVDKDIPKPESWGGFLVKPISIEFWQGQTDRIHDRIRFRKRKTGETVDGILLHQGENDWVYERLAP